jgi:hypothetical protein
MIEFAQRRKDREDSSFAITSKTGTRLGYFNASLISMSRLTGEVFPNASLDRSGQKDLCAGRQVMKAANSLAEVDLSGHLVVFDRPVIHTSYL